jgi:hypothetical protein
MSTKYMENRKYNQGLKNVANWGFTAKVLLNMLRAQAGRSFLFPGTDRYSYHSTRLIQS